MKMGLIHEIDFGTPASRAEKHDTVTVDGFEVTVPEGTSIMRASMEAGIAIPKLCALGGFTPYPVMSAINHFPQDFAPKPVQEAAE
jgi:hypothetical protein